MDTPGLSTLEEAVQEAKLKGRIDDSEYYRMMQIGIRGLTTLNLFSTGYSFKCVKITMNDINCLPLPSDFQIFVAVGIPYNGELFTFTRKQRIIRTFTTVDGVLTQSETEGEGVIIDGNAQVSGYGARGGQNQYYYDIDLANWRIIVNGFPKAECQLWYLSSGISLDSTTYFPSIAMDCLTSLIIREVQQYDKKVPMNQKQYNDQKYFEEFHKMNRLTKSITYDEITDCLYSTIYQTTKR
jgi:hypothetical protein